MRSAPCRTTYDSLPAPPRARYMSQAPRRDSPGFLNSLRSALGFARSPTASPSLRPEAEPEPGVRLRSVSTGAAPGRGPVPKPKARPIGPTSATRLLPACAGPAVAARR